MKTHGLAFSWIHEVQTNEPGNWVLIDSDDSHWKTSFQAIITDVNLTIDSCTWDKCIIYDEMELDILFYLILLFLGPVNFQAENALRVPHWSIVLSKGCEYFMWLCTYDLSFIFNTFEKNLKHFSRCHYGMLCVEFWEEKRSETILEQCYNIKCGDWMWIPFRCTVPYDTSDRDTNRCIMYLLMFNIVFAIFV